jgi:thioredoxin 1
VLVAFTAEGCGPWHLLAPEIAALAESFQGQVTFATLDVEAQPQIPSRYGIGTLPALLFFKDGQVVDQLIGVEDKADIAAKLHTLTRTGQT